MNELPARRRPGRPRIHAGGEGATRGQILQHALRLFQERGYSDVAMGDIAAAVGVTKPTLYYHFGDKETLYTEVLIGLFERIGEQIAAVRHEQQRVADRLAVLAHSGLLYVPRNVRLERMMHDMHLHLAAADQARVTATFERTLLGEIQAIMADGVAAGELRPADPAWLAEIWLALTDTFLARRDRPDQPAPPDPPGLARDLTQLFLVGAGAPTIADYPTESGSLGG